MHTGKKAIGHRRHRGGRTPRQHRPMRLWVAGEHASPPENPDRLTRQIDDRIVHQLRERRAEIAAQTFEAIWLEIPDYSVNWDQRLTEEIQVEIERLIAIMLDAALGSRKLSSDEIAAVTEIGRRLARRGVPLQSLNAAVTTATRMVHRWVVACAAEVDDASHPQGWG